MIEMDKLKKLRVIKFLNDQKWDYDYININGIDYFCWENEDPLQDIEELINDILFIDETMNNDPYTKEIRNLNAWLRSIPDKYNNL